MPRNTLKQPPKESTSNKRTAKSAVPREFHIDFSWLKDRRIQLNAGLLLIFLSVFVFSAFISFIFTGRADQSVVEHVLTTDLRDSGAEIKNWLGLSGAVTAHLFMFRWFGIASFLFPPLIFLLGFRIVFKRKVVKMNRLLQLVLFLSTWFSLLSGYLIYTSDSISSFGFLSGGIGYQGAVLLFELIGNGVVLFLLFAFLAFSIFFLNITSIAAFQRKLKPENSSYEEEIDPSELGDDEADEEVEKSVELGKAEAVPENEIHFQEPTSSNSSAKEIKNEEQEPTLSLEIDLPDEEPILSTYQKSGEKTEEEDVELELGQQAEETQSSTIKNYDPTQDLSQYKFPHLELLVDREDEKIKVTREELEANKDIIVETLSQFNIGISSIKATVGPTVTLYEIVPAPGIRISKIRGLEDDIALNLSALGIRIIAPIPGKGTIGIEVPNKNREIVSAKSVFQTEKFTKSDFTLPIVLGKTINNEVYMADLAKLPHLLIAGATGQGKSVGLNVILASLLYKKHPSQLKFVLVDPKKVEFSIFERISNHFLAQNPTVEEPIITDNSKVVNTLMSLTNEMDTRYELMRVAGCRIIKEYNKKFVERKLDPNEGHRFMPYIVLVIDELADLMVHSGKEVEKPIVRLAQLARAVGIHLILATQRPSVDVITGIIKANFPARLSYKVSAKVDSRTILDQGGAEQLTGLGDLLFTAGSDIVRLQSPYLDTPEVESVVDYIGNQRGYSSPYMLPEYEGDEGRDKSEIDLSERDSMFEEAARVVVMHQQGSTSLIQRKLSIGYARSGRIMDQLEAAGIAGAFNGSKARDVLVHDLEELERLLKDLA